MSGRRVVAPALALAVALSGCASVSHVAQDRSLAALKTQDPKPGDPLPPLGPPKGCNKRNVLRSLPALHTLPRPGHMPRGSSMRAIQRRKLRVGVDQNSLRLGYFNPTTERMEGFDIDVVRAVARAIFGGHPDDHITYTAISTQQREAAIAFHDVDIVASAFSITCERKARVAFSSVYHHARQRLLVPEDSNVHKLSDLRVPILLRPLTPKPICATSASTTVTSLEGTGVEPYRVELRSDCLVALQERDVAAATSDDTILHGLCLQDPQTKIVGPTIEDEYYGLAMGRDRKDLVRFVNAVLKRVDREQLRRKWFRGLRAAAGGEIRRCGAPGL